LDWVQQAQAFLTRLETKSARDDDQRIEKLYRVAFQRAPERDEVLLAKQFLATQITPTNTSSEPVIWQYGYGEFDEKTSRVKTFKALPHFTGTAWQGGDKLPDAKLGWVLLNAEGGHVGNDLQHAAIRRWKAPTDGQVKVLAVEEVSVAAGKFKTWKVEVSSAEGEPGVTTLWVASDSRKIVKTAATLPNATITSELQP